MDRYCMTGCLETRRQIPQRFVSTIVGKVHIGTVGVKIKVRVCGGVGVAYVLPHLMFMRPCSGLAHLPVCAQVHVRI